MTLFREMGVRVVEETIPREMLYVADEVFFTGSAAEITPIRSIDKIIDRHRQARARDREGPGGLFRRHQRPSGTTPTAG